MPSRFLPSITTWLSKNSLKVVKQTHVHGSQPLHSPKASKQKIVARKRFQFSVKQPTKQKEKKKTQPQTPVDVLWFWLGCGFWHNSHFNLIPTFPSLSFLMIQPDSKAGDSRVRLPGAATTPTAERTPLSGFLGVFLQVVTTHHQSVIKPFRLSTAKSPLKTPRLQTQPFVPQLLWQPVKGVGCPRQSRETLHPRNCPNTTKSTT